MQELVERLESEYQSGGKDMLITSLDGKSYYAVRWQTIKEPYLAQWELTERPARPVYINLPKLS